MIQFEDTVFALQFAADAAQCMIRQTKQLLPALRDEEEEEPDEPGGSFEREEEMETRIRGDVEREMMETIPRKERQSGTAMQEMREIVRSLPRHHRLHDVANLQAANDVTETANLKLKHSTHSLEAEIAHLEMNLGAVVTENS
jgi:hypothetical protein